MQIKIVQKAIDKLRGKNKENSPCNKTIVSYDAHLNLEDLETISNFKKQAWQGDSANTYYKLVDNDFFSSVTFEYFRKYIKPTDKVLDVGAGTGRLSLAIAKLGCEVVASDISESMLSYINRNKGNLNIKTVISEGEHIPLEDGQFDVVTSLDLICHFPQWQNFIKEKARLCKKGGLIIFSAVNGNHLQLVSWERNQNVLRDKLFYGSNYVANITREELEKFAKENNLTLEKIQPYDFLSRNAYLCDKLTSEEIYQLLVLLTKAKKCPKWLEVIKQFELNTVKNLSEDSCADMIVYLRKNA